MWKKEIIAIKLKSRAITQVVSAVDTVPVPGLSYFQKLFFSLIVLMPTHNYSTLGVFLWQDIFCFGFTTAGSQHRYSRIPPWCKQNNSEWGCWGDCISKACSWCKPTRTHAVLGCSHIFIIDNVHVQKALKIVSETEPGKLNGVQSSALTFRLCFFRKKQARFLRR